MKLKQLIAISSPDTIIKSNRRVRLEEPVKLSDCDLRLNEKFYNTVPCFLLSFTRSIIPVLTFSSC